VIILPFVLSLARNKCGLPELARSVNGPRRKYSKNRKPSTNLRTHVGSVLVPAQLRATTRVAPPISQPHPHDGRPHGDEGIAGGDEGIAGGDEGIASGDEGIAGGDEGIAGGDEGLACEMAPIGTDNRGMWVKLLMVWGNGRLLAYVVEIGKRGVARFKNRPQQPVEDLARACSYFDEEARKNMEIIR